MPKSTAKEPFVLNEAQIVCLKTYCGGEFEHLTKIRSEMQFRGSLDGCGDGLLRFLVTELATSEDCDSASAAVDRVATAIAELEAVRGHLEAAAAEVETAGAPVQRG